MTKREQERLESASRDPRMRLGWGASLGASQEEKEAFEAAEKMPLVQAGQLPVSALPEAYGGRPTGKTRRDIRMRAEYDKEQADLLNQQRVMQQMEQDRKQMEIANAQEIRAAAKYQSDLDEARAQAKIDSETEVQRARFDSGLAELDPRSSDFLDQFAALSRENRLALESPSTQRVAAQYLKINEIYRAGEEADTAEAINKKAARDNQLAQLTKLAKLTGRDLSDLARSDMQTQELIVDPIALGEAEADLARKPAKEITDPAASVLRQEAKELRGSIRDIDLNIVTAQTELRAATNDKTRAAAETKLSELMAQRQLLDTDRQGVEAALAGAGQEAPAPAVQKPTNAQIESARRAATDQNQSPALRNAARRFLEDNGIDVEAEAPAPQTGQPQINLAPVPTPPPAAAAPQPTPEQILQTSNDPLELARASGQAAEQKSKKAKEEERQAYIQRVEKAFEESPVPNPDVFQTPKAKEIAASPNARELAQERYRELQSAAFTGGLRTALPKKKKEISDDVFEKVLAEMLELRILLGESPRDAQDLIDRIRSNK
jgi:hypothetical protein